MFYEKNKEEKNNITLGLRKTGRYNRLTYLLTKKNIKYSTKELMELSSAEMKRRIEELEPISENRKNSWENRGKTHDMF